MDTKRFFLYAIVIAALALAGCGGNGGTTAMEDPMRDPDPMPPANLAAAKSAAMTAATAAGEAADAAEAAANAQTDNMAADEANYALAQNAAMRARTAATAAAVANNLAQVATDVAAAEAQRDIAQSQQATAEAEQANAVRYANMVMMAQQGIDDEDQRVMDVASARSAAMQSYMDANADATKAEAAATAAEETAPNSAGAMAARAAATAARAAATAAKAAHDAIMDGMTKAEADAQATMAATEAGNAKSQYMTAKIENDTIQTAAIVNEEKQRMRDIANARDAAKMYAEEALGHYNAAVGKAADARAEATRARMAANRAMAARMDYANADKYADMAEAAADKAEAAEATALMAKDAAQAAYMDAMNAETVAAAQMARNEAKAQNVIATAQHTGADGAGMNYMAAKDAAGKAMTAADKHVLGLLKSANAVNVMDATPSTDENEAQTAAIGLAATAVGTAAEETDNGEDGTTATATWPGVVDDPDTDDTDESEGSVLSIMVDPKRSGATMMFRTVAMEDDPETEDIDESAKTATMIAGLGDFMHGYSITDGNRHAIVFTDRTQDDAPVTAVTAITAKELVNHAVSGNTITALGTRSGTGYTGVTYYEGTATDDTGTAFTGTLTCPSGTECTATTQANGTIAVEGFVFSGSRQARAAVTAMNEAAQAAANQDYLAFGVWLHEDADGNDTADDPQFGAFATGGSPATLAAAITGTATYNGKATGVYTAGESVDYFQGDATLTASFGTPPETGADPDTELGTITGMINNIFAGGRSMTDVIHLNDDGSPADGNILAAGTFSGDARMGTATTVDEVTTYTHNGFWSGQFFNGTPDDTTTTDVDESLVAPGSVAGTFGVTGTVGEGDAAMTRSYLGAFGAHK